MTTLPLQTGIQQSLVKRYRHVRQQTERICQPLEAEDFVVQPHDDVSPPKWHLGHTTWFFETFILEKYLDAYQTFDDRLKWFFNSYYESQGPRILRSKRGNMTRPGVSVILDYRHQVDESIAQLLNSYEEEQIPEELRHLIEVGLQHEQQHQELLVTDIKYILGTNPLFPVYKKIEVAPADQPVAPAEWLSFKEDIYQIGFEGEGFCWDNELSLHRVLIPAFDIQSRLVTNGEYIEFMEADGYKDHRHWLSEGWEWAKQLDSKAPLYWYEQDGEWYQYTLGGLQKVDPNLPVTHISYFEADAYANWKGCRLPTEFEWEAACKHHYDRIPANGNFLDRDNFHPLAAKGPDDLQMLGHTWEWTASAYQAYPAYPRFKGALGEYNGKFMVNQMVLRGGSCATPQSHIRISYRNFFQTDKRWQFTGFRLAR